METKADSYDIAGDPGRSSGGEAASRRTPRRRTFLLVGLVMTVLGIGLFYITTIAHQNGPTAVAFIGGGNDAVATFDGTTIQANTAIYTNDPQGAAHARAYCGMSLPGRSTVPWNVLQLNIGGGPANVCLHQGQSQTFGRINIRIEQVGQVQAQRHNGSPIALSRVALSISTTPADQIAEAGAALMLGLGPALLGAAAVSDGTPPAPGTPASEGSSTKRYDLANADDRRYRRRRMFRAVSGGLACVAVAIVGAASLAANAGPGGAVPRPSVSATSAPTPGSSKGAAAQGGPVRVEITFRARQTPPAAVAPAILVQGTARNLRHGEKIWVFTQNPGDSHVNPQPQAAVITPSGNWSSRTFVGSAGDAGKQFQILVAVADSAAAQTITTYLANANRTGNFPGLPRLPAGARQYGQVSVVRN